MLYERLFEKLYLEKIRYVVAGGMAVVLHGIPRFTMDLDLIVALQKENLKKFLSVMKQLGYRPKVLVGPYDFADPQKRREWIEKKNMLVFSFYHPRDLRDIVDIFVQDPIPFKELYRDKVVGHLGPIKIYLVSIPHLVKIKKQAGRKQDLDDVEQLKRLQKKQREKHGKTKRNKKRI